jgi:hypothetical protein
MVSFPPSNLSCPVSSWEISFLQNGSCLPGWANREQGMEMKGRCRVKRRKQRSHESGRKTEVRILSS